MSLFFKAKLSCNIFILIPTTSAKVYKLRKSIRPASYLPTQPKLLTVFHPSKSQCLRTERTTLPVTLNYAGTSVSVCKLGNQVHTTPCQIKLMFLSQKSGDGRTRKYTPKFILTRILDSCLFLTTYILRPSILRLNY